MEELDEIVERFEKEHKRWRAVGGNYFYYLAPTGLRSVKDFREKESDWFYDTGNYFKTKEEAEQRFEHMITEQQLKDIALRLNKGEKIDWEDEEQKKFHLCLFYGSLSYNSNILGKTQGVIYCLDENFKDIAIKEIGKERLINYLKES